MWLLIELLCVNFPLGVDLVIYLPGIDYLYREYATELCVLQNLSKRLGLDEHDVQEENGTCCKRQNNDWDSTNSPSRFNLELQATCTGLDPVEESGNTLKVRGQRESIQHVYRRVGVYTACLPKGRHAVLIPIAFANRQTWFAESQTKAC